MTTAALRVWHTELRIEVAADVAPELLERLLWQQVTQLDEAASRFRPDSQVSMLHRAAGRWTPVGPVLQEVLRLALHAAAITEGMVHPGLGAAVAAAGYDAWMSGATASAAASADPRMPSLGLGRGDGAASVAACEPVGADARDRPLPWQAIELRAGAARIPAGMVLDLGAVGKAWLADSLARALHQATSAAVVADMGGDLRVISPTQPVAVWLDPELPGVAPLAVQVHDAGIATSGLPRRRWAGGHHIIDPRTGAPAQTPWWSVSALACDAVAANTAATAAMVLGEPAPAWLTKHHFPARLVAADGRDVRAGRLADQGRAA